MHYVLVGGSIAAASAMAEIRKNDPGAEVTVVSPEAPFYFRPLIPMLIDGSRSMDEISYSAEVEGVTRLITDTAVGLDTQAQEVMLGSGEKLTYDRLLIATGSGALLPDIQGGASVMPMRTSADALALKDAASNVKEALVVGGGLVGIKTSLALGKLGLKVTMVEKLDQLLYPRLDQRGATMVEERLRQAGIAIFKGETVAEASGGRARLSGGAEAGAQVVVAAVGTAPNVGWLEGSGINAQGGIAVNDALMTSLEGVYAAGDAASFTDVVSGEIVQSALWTNAVDMGRAAGTNMAGGSARCPGIWQVLNATEIEGIPMVSAGRVEAGPGEEAFAHEGSRGYRKLVFNGKRLTGCIFMGEVKGAGVYTNLIKNRTELSEAQRRKAMDATLGYADFALAGAH